MRYPILKEVRPLEDDEVDRAGVEGIEPSSGVLETLILPMNYTPIC